MDRGLPIWLSGFQKTRLNMDNFDPEEMLGLIRGVTPEDVETLSQLQQIQSRNSSEREDLNLRQLYGRVLLGLLSLQVFFVVTVVFLLGFSVITLDRWVATASLGGTSGVSGMAYLTVRYLFPPPFRG